MKIECPWCLIAVQVEPDGSCPLCRHVIATDPGAGFVDGNNSLTDPPRDAPVLGVTEAIESRFRCAKCGGRDCRTEEVAMTGTGLSKMFDIQHHHYLFVSCLGCGFTEVYNPDVLQGKKAGQLGSILDVLFG